LRPGCPREGIGRLISRGLSAALAALVIDGGTAAYVHAQAAGPFPDVPLRTSPNDRSHVWAYVAMFTGVALIGGSFLLDEKADDTYEEYLVETDPGRIEQLYDQTTRYDRFAQASLLTGEALVLTGVYFRFIHRPKPSKLRLVLAPDRCALALRF
jgi:hypothetical protein